MDTPLLPSQETQDTGRAWIILFCATTLNFLTDGNLKAYGVIHAELTRIDPSAASDVLAAQSTTLGISMAFCVVAKMMYTKFGVRLCLYVGTIICATGYILTGLVIIRYTPLVFLSFSLVNGFGTGIVFMVTILVVGDYFSMYFHFAVATCIAGCSFGGLIWPCIIEELISLYRLENCVIILGLLMLNGIPLTMLIRPRNYYGLNCQDFIIKPSAAHSTLSMYGSGQESSPTTDEIASNNNSREAAQTSSLSTKLKYLWQKYTCDRKVFLISLSVSLSMACSYASLILVSARSVEIGLNESQFATVQTVCGLGDVIGRIVMGIAYNQPMFEGRRLFLSTTSMAVFSILTLLSPLAYDTLTMSLYAFNLGCFGLSILVAVPSIALDVFGKDRYEKISANMLSCSTPFFPAIVLISNYCYRVNGNYSWSLIVVGIIQMVAVVLVIIETIIGFAQINITDSNGLREKKTHSRQ